MPHEHYSKAPIIEAQVSIQTSPGPSFHESSIVAFADEISVRYPVRHDMTVVPLLVPVSPDGVLQPKPAIRGLRLDTQTAPQKVVFARPDWFAFSWLAPYDNWHALRRQSRDEWAIYANHVNPGPTTRLAIKYINKMSF